MKSKKINIFVILLLVFLFIAGLYIAFSSQPLLGPSSKRVLEVSCPGEREVPGIGYGTGESSGFTSPEEGIEGEAFETEAKEYAERNAITECENLINQYISMFDWKCSCSTCDLSQIPAKCEVTSSRIITSYCNPTYCKATAEASAEGSATFICEGQNTCQTGQH